MLKKTFHYETVREKDVFRIDNLLHLTVRNQGTNDVVLLGVTLKPTESYNIPSDGIAFLEQIKVEITFEGNQVNGNNAYMTYTTLTRLRTDKNC